MGVGKRYRPFGHLPPGCDKVRQVVFSFQTHFYNSLSLSHTSIYTVRTVLVYESRLFTSPACPSYHSYRPCLSSPALYPMCSSKRTDTTNEEHRMFLRPTVEPLKSLGRHKSSGSTTLYYPLNVIQSVCTLANCSLSLSFFYPPSLWSNLTSASTHQTVPKQGPFVQHFYCFLSNNSFQTKTVCPLTLRTNTKNK